MATFTPEQVQDMYGPIEWMDYDDLILIPSFFEFEGVSYLKACDVAGTLAAVERHGAMPEGPLDMFEFGSAKGDGLIALDMLARSRPGSTVIGSEYSDEYRTASQVSDLLETVESVEPNGYPVMRKNPEKFDLILANMFGPSYDDQERIAQFVPEAMRALKLGGVIVMNSDAETMGNAINWAVGNLPPHQMEIMPRSILPSCLSVMTHVLFKK